jgi:hypothetical protein
LLKKIRSGILKNIIIYLDYAIADPMDFSQGFLILFIMENLETLVTIITEKNKTIESLRKDLKANGESSMFWYRKYKELEESLTPKTEE